MQRALVDPIYILQNRKRGDSAFLGRSSRISEYNHREKATNRKSKAFQMIFRRLVFRETVGCS